MIEGGNPVLNAFLGTLVTWGLTAAGSSLVFFLPEGQHQALLDGSLGFAAGVMIAASFWSLLAPSIENAANLGYVWIWFPATAGFLMGGAGIAFAERFLPGDLSAELLRLDRSSDDDVLARNVVDDNGLGPEGTEGWRYDNDKDSKRKRHLEERGARRILLLVLAITIHNLPEGLAVGVGFGAVGSKGGTTIREARALAWGIGLQNFPEGLSVSLPLHRAGLSRWRSFWLGQLSGAVEPVAGVLGALLIRLATPVLPYALGFAAGAMIWVVVDDLIPEAVASGREGGTSWSTWGCMVGFVVMMILDVALG